MSSSLSQMLGLELMPALAVSDSKRAAPQEKTKTLQGLASRDSKMQSTLIATSHAMNIMNGHTDHTKMHGFKFKTNTGHQVTLSLDKWGTHSILKYFKVVDFCLKVSSCNY